MKRVVMILALCATPAAAEEGELGLLGEWLKGRMEGFASEILPLMKDFAGEIEDLKNYQAPEVLPNGDILIRRKPESPAKPDLPIDPDAESIEL